MATPLPIDEHLDAVFDAMMSAGSAVVVAEPGAGKTTRIPAMLSERTGLPVLCTQPRRLAARMAAARVAEESGVRLGAEVGYELRFESKVSEATRLRFLTEGIAMRQWKRWSGRERILVLDEFHERHLDADVLLALARQEQAAGGALKILVMSATLDPSAVSEFLGDAPIIHSTGRSYPVVARYQEPRANEKLEVQVSRALRDELREGLENDVLVFLPGMAEIRRCSEYLEELARHHELELLPLHGSLSVAEQDRALRPSSRRKVILSTNVAETSVTIDGVGVVIDAGTARVARHNPWTGLSSLQIEAVSQASADQRMGRAGRTRAGRCVRLYAQHEYLGRRNFDLPEIARSDLASAELALAANRQSFATLSFFEAPPAAALEAAHTLLERLGALEESGLSELGKALAALPLHPRLGRLVLAAKELGIPRLGASAAALLAERPLRYARRKREPATASSQSDVHDDCHLLDEILSARNSGAAARSANADLNTARQADKSRKQILRALGTKGPDAEMSAEAEEEALSQALLYAFPDRVGRRIKAGGKGFLLCEGGAVQQCPSSAVLDAEFVVALDAETRESKGRKETVMRTAAAVDPSWLLELEDLRDVDEHSYDANSERVVRSTGIYLGAIAVDEELIVDPSRLDPVETRRVLAELLAKQGIGKVVDKAGIRDFRRRVGFAAKQRSDLEWPSFDDAELAEAVLDLAEGATKLSQLKGLNLVDALQWRLDAEQRKLLGELAPSHVSIPGRKRVPIHYEEDRDPWIESRLQDFFGLKKGPSVAGGRVPLTLHLQAPNRRAVQVTTDLEGFWERHYPALRKQLMRRYSRHHWPENPLEAEPRKKRS